jgi:hypothetical protein
VTVIVPPQTVTVYARDEGDAQRQAVWVIGVAGFERAAKFETRDLGLSSSSKNTP